MGERRALISLFDQGKLAVLYVTYAMLDGWRFHRLRAIDVDLVMSSTSPRHRAQALGRFRFDPDVCTARSMYFDTDFVEHTDVRLSKEHLFPDHSIKLH